MNENKKYPEQARKDSIEGRVVVSFTVESDGTITNAQVVKSLHPLLDAEALRVVNLMPKWEPGAQSRYNLPIYFKLN
jgi:TonB family protein